MHGNNNFAVFGLGRYGIAVAKELVENGKEVIAVDSNQKIINDAAAYLPVCKCADVTDTEVISRLGLDSIDTVIICMASNLEASIMAVTLCKELGVPTVIAKCANEMHQKILLRIGADQVVFPERESGIRLARNLVSSGFIDMTSLSEDISMAEIDVKHEWVGKSLIELNLRKKHAINVVAIRNGNEITANVDPALPLNKEMKLFVITNTTKLRKLK